MFATLLNMNIYNYHIQKRTTTAIFQLWLGSQQSHSHKVT